MWRWQVTAMLTEASKTTFDPNSDIKPTMLYPMNAQIDQINWDELRSALASFLLISSAGSGYQPQKRKHSLFFGCVLTSNILTFELGLVAAGPYPTSSTHFIA
jgi:hypothetical protein